ncbi:MAG TPA: hypothetical protein VJU87_09375 [Gemmatimonadaceae bacterium]|nr:hypothetical protein [Gemmatimonadaceae bacterium]
MSDLAAARKPPTVFTRGHALYYVDAFGAEWSVFDCLDVSGRLVVVRTGSKAAEFRVFSLLNGLKRRYEFRTTESRELEMQRLERQMAESEAMLEE